MLKRVPLLGRFGGGECWSSSSVSEESTTGVLRAARSFPMPPQVVDTPAAKGSFSPPRASGVCKRVVAPLVVCACTSGVRSRRRGIIRPWRVRVRVHVTLTAGAVRAMPAHHHRPFTASPLATGCDHFVMTRSAAAWLPGRPSQWLESHQPNGSTHVSKYLVHGNPMSTFDTLDMAPNRLFTCPSITHSVPPVVCPVSPSNRFRRLLHTRATSWLDI